MPGPPKPRIRPLPRTRPQPPVEFQVNDLMPQLTMIPPAERQLISDALSEAGISSFAPPPFTDPKDAMETMGFAAVAGRELGGRKMLLPGVVPPSNELTVETLKGMVENPIQVGMEALNPAVNPGFPFSAGMGTVVGRSEPMTHPFYVGPWQQKHGAGEATAAQNVWAIRDMLSQRLHERGAYRAKGRGRAGPTQTYLAPELDQVADYLAARYEAEPALRRYAQGTRAVDPSTGYPRPTLHATQAEFSAFRPGSSPGIAEKMGSWHAEDPELAASAGRWQVGGASNVVKPGPGMEEYLTTGIDPGIGLGPIKSRFSQEEMLALRGGASKFMPNVIQVRNPLTVSGRDELEAAIIQRLYNTGDRALAAEMMKEQVYQGLVMETSSPAGRARLKSQGLTEDQMNPETVALYKFGSRKYGQPPHTNEQEMQIAQQVLRALKSAGFDGIYMADDMGFGPAWVAFDPQQVKSVFNTGGWSTDPDTMKILPWLFPGTAAAYGLQEE